MTDDVDTLHGVANVAAVGQIALAYLALEIGRQFQRVKGVGDKW